MGVLYYSVFQITELFFSISNYLEFPRCICLFTYCILRLLLTLVYIFSLLKFSWVHLLSSSEYLYDLHFQLLSVLFSTFSEALSFTFICNIFPSSLILSTSVSVYHVLKVVAYVKGVLWSPVVHSLEPGIPGVSPVWGICAFLLWLGHDSFRHISEQGWPQLGWLRLLQACWWMGLAPGTFWAKGLPILAGAACPMWQEGHLPGQGKQG